jgi:hypothetical protein
LSVDAVIESFSGAVHCVQGKEAYASRGNTVYRSEDGGATWELLFELVPPFPGRLSSASRLLRRLCRAGVQHIVHLNGTELIVVANGYFHAYDLAAGRLCQEVAPVRGRRPLTLCATSEPALYYGEYRSNSERSPVHVFASKDRGRTWDEAHEFREVRHIHGVFEDAYAQALWVTTGDEDDECGLWMTRDRFGTLERVLGGSQQARAVQVVPTRRFLYFGSDSPSGPNAIYRLSRDLGAVEKLCDVNGPVFYGCRVGESLFFSTACEPGVESPYATVWGSPGGESWRPVVRFRKDPWSKRFFQYGQVRFPVGTHEEGTLWMTPMGTTGDQRSLKLDIQRLWAAGGIATGR